jgi:hypothetical protein
LVHHEIDHLEGLLYTDRMRLGVAPIPGAVPPERQAVGIHRRRDDVIGVEMNRAMTTRGAPLGRTQDFEFRRLG